jgi:ADP-ribose pyrophosphatase
VSFRLLGSRRLASGELLTFDREHLLAADGQVVRRDVIRHPGGVAIVAAEGEKVWLVSQRRAPFARHLLEIPAGKLDPTDRDPEAAARRELSEELGVVADEFGPLGTVYPSPGYSNEILHLFYATGLTHGERRPQGAEELAASVIEMPLVEALRSIEEGSICDAKTQVALLLWARRSSS